MNPLHVSKMVRVCDGYTEKLYVVWEEGKFKTPMVMLSEYEMDQLVLKYQTEKKRKQ